MNILFFGSGSFPLKMFKSLMPHHNLSLVTIPQKNAIEQFAKANEIDVYTPILDRQKRKEQWKSFKHPQMDFGIVCNFGYMLPSYVIDRFEKGLIVCHPSLLPLYRGASPIQRALMDGANETGVSFIDISKKVDEFIPISNKKVYDAGSILYQEKISIQPEDRFKEVSEQLENLAEDKINYIIDNLDELRKNAIKQDENKMTTAPKIMDVKPNFETQTASEIQNLYRGLYGTNFKSLKLQFKGKELLVESMRLANELV